MRFSLLYQYNTKEKLIVMKKYVLPTLVSFALSSYVLAQEPSVPEPPTPPAIPSSDANMVDQHQKMMDKQMTYLQEQITQMQETRAQIEKIRQTRDPQKRQELMEEMRQSQQEKREKMWKERGATMPNRPDPRFGGPHFNQPHFNQPRFGGPGWHGPQMPPYQYGPSHPNSARAPFGRNGGGMMPGYGQGPGNFGMPGQGPSGFGMPGQGPNGFGMPGQGPNGFAKGPGSSGKSKHLGFHARVEQRLEKIDKQLQELIEALKDK